jgi:tight adherence protein B
MVVNFDAIAASVMIGAAVGVGGYYGRGYLAQALDILESDMADKLARLRASSRHLRKIIIAWLIGIAATFVGFWVMLNQVLLGLVLAALLVLAPWYILRRMAEWRRRKIEDQLADAMVSLANGVKAGLSLAQALEMLANDSPWPINVEFRQIVNEYKMGRPLDRTLVEAKNRLRSENFALFAAAMLASYESGGKLNETVERIAHSVLELQRLERKVQSETAQARKAAIYMALVPAFVLAVYYVAIDAENTKLLFTSPVGQAMLATAIVLNVIAYLWARSILNPDI